MPPLGSLLSEWFSSDTSWIVFTLGGLLGWILGLVWWWYFTGRTAAVAPAVDDVMRLEARLENVESTLTARTGELHGLQAELSATSDRASAELTDLRSARDEAVARLADLESELNAMPDVAAFEMESPSTDDDAAEDDTADDDTAEIITGLERQLLASRELAADAVRAHGGCDERAERLQRAVEVASAERDALVEERDGLRTQLADVERELAGRTGELDGARANVAALTAERDAARDELAALRAGAGARDELEAELNALRRDRDQARQDARQQALDMQNEFDDATRRVAEDLARLRDERKRFQDQLRLAGSEVERMRDEASRAAASDAEADRLRARLAAVEGRYTADVRERDGKIAELLARVTALQDEMRNPPKPKRPARDELQRIYGIGPVLERKLHGMGYLRFEDIAAWRREDVERVAKELGSFPDRIERDAWVAQAARFAREMQDEYAD